MLSGHGTSVGGAAAVGRAWSSGAVSSTVALVLTVLALVTLAATALHLGGVGMRAAPARAIARASLQLTVVSLLIALALRDTRVAALFVLVMLGAVAFTSGRRLGGGRRRIGQVLLASLCGAAPVVLLLLGTGAFPRTNRYVIAFAGIVLGGTMTVCTLSGRRLRDAARDRWSEVEAWLALGATARQAMRPLQPEAVREALLPGIDQARTTGLVTLPGAFVGALAGGASPAQAAQLQVAVLAGLGAAQAVSAVVLVQLIAPDFAVAPVTPVAEAAATGGRSVRHLPGWVASHARPG